MKDNKKREIQQIALDLFRQETYEKVSVNQIAKAAGISKNTFYYYFTSKEELVRDILRPELFIDEDVIIQLSALDDPLEQIHALNESMIRYFVKLGKPIVKVAFRANLNNEFLIVEKDNYHELPMIMKITMNFFKRAIEAKVIRTDLKAHQLMALTGVILFGVLQMWASAPRELDLEKFFMGQIDAVLCVKKA